MCYRIYFTEKSTVPSSLTRAQGYCSQSVTEAYVVGLSEKAGESSYSLNSHYWYSHRTLLYKAGPAEDDI